MRHSRGCTICAGGGGHPLSVLTVGYAGGRTRQFSLRREQVDEVRRWLGNYHKLKQAIDVRAFHTACWLRARSRNLLQLLPLRLVTDQRNHTTRCAIRGLPLDTPAW